MKGIELSRRYYEQYGKPMLEREFGDYFKNMTIGLSGEGSDCYGFDDAQSADHDWGPDFCIWIDRETYNEIGDRLTKGYNSLPDEFEGYKRVASQRGARRRGVLCSEDFYISHLGTANYEDIDWGRVNDYELATVTNGEIFKDGSQCFDDMRSRLLKGYPESMLYLKLADDLGIISQTGQYNFQRMIKRGDRITANIMLIQSIRQIMILAHHVNGRYPMHDKWLHKSFLSILPGSELVDMIGQLNSSLMLDNDKALAVVSDTMEHIGEYIAKTLYDMDIISDVESYLDLHTDELVRKAKYAAMSDKELVNLIARTEFEAFDKVRNEGGRASCQNDWPTFSVMRKSQYLTWNRTMLLQYIYDFNREMSVGHNLITEKYGRMMESTAPDKYDEIKDKFEPLSEQKKAVIEQIVALQIDMVEEFGVQHPALAGNARSFHTYEDNYMNTSYETYLRGEISTYSDKMLQLYGKYVVDCVKNGINIACETIENTARLYGFADLTAFENGKNQTT